MGGNRQEARGSPNGGNRLQVSDTFTLSLKQQEETNWRYILPSSLYKFKKRLVLKYRGAIMTPGST